MSMRDNIESGIRNRKALASDNIVDQFTEALSIALDKFLKRLNSGQLEIDNITDLQRVYIMWKEIIEFNEMKNGNNGALPEIKSNEIRALEEHGILGEDATKIDLTSKSQEDMNRIALDLMNSINNKNAGDM